MTDFTSTEHPGNNGVGMFSREGSIGRGDPAVLARVKLQVAAGSSATYSQVVLLEVR